MNSFKIGIESGKFGINKWGGLMKNEGIEWLRQYLKNNGIKQNYVAKRAGYSDKVLSSLLRGRRRFQVDDLLKLSYALNIEPEKFLKKYSEKFGNKLRPILKEDPIKSGLRE